MSLIVAAARVNSQRCAFNFKPAYENVGAYPVRVSLFVPFILPCTSKKMYFCIYFVHESTLYSCRIS